MRSGLLSALVILVAGALLVGASLDGGARSGGIGDPKYAKKGCLCHGQGSTPATGDNPAGAASAGTDVALTVENATGTFVPGVAYDLTLTVVNAAVQTAPNAMFVAGFGLLVTNGTLANPDANTQVNGEGAWATHTSTGAAQSQWFLTWTAPDAPNVTFHFSGNKVNGNTLNDPLDQWNRGTLELTSAGAPPPPVANNTTDNGDRGKDDDTPGFELVLVTLAVAAAVFVARRRKA